MVVRDILRVLYAPHKVFKDIIQNPKYLGPLILLIIFLVAQISASYIAGSRTYLEQTMPIGDQADVWTENAALWQANAGVAISDNRVDFINGTQALAGVPDYYGNSSIEFTLSNSSLIQMALSDLGGSVNCGADGFKSLSVRVEIVSPDVKPENVSLFLYSLSDSNFFYYDLTSEFSSSAVNVWNNITVPLGAGNWVSSNTTASWENITSLKMDFTWPDSSNIDLRVDGLYFRGAFKSQVELLGATTILATSALNGIAPFLFEWLLLTGLIYVLIKAFKGNVVWKPLMIAVGFALVTLTIQALIVVALYTTLPNLHYPLEVLSYVSGEFDAAYQVIVDQIALVSLAGYIVQAAMYVWTVALGTFITRAVTEFAWMKSLLVSGASLLLTIIIMGFLLGV